MTKSKVFIYALLSVATIFLTYQVIGSLLALFLFNQDIPNNINNFRLYTIATQILLILVPALLFSKKFFNHIDEVIPIKPIPFKDLTLFFVGYFLVYANLSNIFYFQTKLIEFLAAHSTTLQQIKSFFESNSEVIEKSYRTLLATNTPYDFLVVFLMITITPAICEEVFFRGYLQHFMFKSFGFIATSLFVGISFSFLHFDFSSIIPLTLLSMYFSYTVYRSKSILSSVFLHFTNNFMAFLATAFFKIDDMFDKSQVVKDVDFKSALASFAILSIALFLLIMYIEKLYKNKLQAEENNFV